MPEVREGVVRAAGDDPLDLGVRDALDVGEREPDPVGAAVRQVRVRALAPRRLVLPGGLIDLNLLDRNLLDLNLLDLIHRDAVILFTEVHDRRALRIEIVHCRDVASIKAARRREPGAAG